MSTWNRHVVLPSSKRVDDSPTTKVPEKREPAEEVKIEEEEEVKIEEEEVKNPSEFHLTEKREHSQTTKVQQKREHSQTTKLKQKREPAEEVKNGEEDVKNVKNLSEFHLTAITLITTVTFAVSLQVPGGYNNSTGKAVLSENNNFKYFLIFDSLAFGTSAGLMLMHLIILMAPSGWFGWVDSLPKRLTIPLIGISVIEMILAFWWGLKSVLDEKSTFTSAINKCIFISFAIPFFLSFLFCLLIIILVVPFIWRDLILRMKRLRAFMERLNLRGYVAGIYILSINNS